MVKKNYSSDIRIMIRKTGMDVTDLAIAIDASEKSIYKWMNGTSMPNAEHLLALISLVNQADEAGVQQLTLQPC